MPVGCGTSRVSAISGEVGWNTERDVERGETKVLVFSKHERVVVTWAWSNKGTTRERNVFCTSLLPRKMTMTPYSETLLKRCTVGKSSVQLHRGVLIV